LKDCGDFPCTGPNNVLYSFKRSTFTGITPNVKAADFQIIYNN